MLEANADKDKALKDGTTPLCVAAQTGQLDVARLLLEAKADMNKAPQGGRTPLFISAENDHIETARLLRWTKQQTRCSRLSLEGTDDNINDVLQKTPI